MRSGKSKDAGRRDPTPRNVCIHELRVVLFGAPVDEVAGIEGDAEKIGGDKSELSGADADDADDGAIDGGHDPALPEFLANEHGGENGQDAGQIIKPDDVKNIKHVGSMRQGQQKRTICWRGYVCDLPPLRWRRLLMCQN
jgi:hypothetical protein